MSFKGNEFKGNEFKGNEFKLEKDFILLIFNCVKYKHKALKQKNTWLRELSSLKNKDKLIYFHVIGNPDLDQDFLINAEQHPNVCSLMANYFQHLLEMLVSHFFSR